MILALNSSLVTPGIYHLQQKKKKRISRTPQLVCRILPSGSGGGGRGRGWRIEKVKKKGGERETLNIFLKSRGKLRNS